MPIVFGEDIGAAPRRAVPSIANDALILSTAGYLLWQNIITLERLVPLPRDSGADLEAALRDAHSWAKLTEDKSNPRSIEEQNREFPPGLADLARALNVTLDEGPAQARLKLETPSAALRFGPHEVATGAVLARHTSDLPTR